MYKGVLFDIDDTLYSHKDNEVPKATLKLLDKLKEKNIKIGVCTSRFAGEMNSFPKQLINYIDCKIIGTGSVTMIENEYYKPYFIESEYAKQYFDYFEKHNISYSYTDENADLFYWGDLDKVNNGELLGMANGKVMFKKYEGENVTNLFYYFASEEEKEYIASINKEAYISCWGNCGNICASYVDKGFGVLKFCEVYHLTTDEVVACGDGHNDGEMLEMAGLGIAVKGAKKEAIEKADYVCVKTIEDGGLYDAFIENGIIEEDKYDIKAFFFDNDSTLFDHTNHRIGDGAYESLVKLKENGYKICLNTSRGLDECYNIPKEVMDIFDIVSLLGGAYVLDNRKPIIKLIKKHTIEKLVVLFDKLGLVYRFATTDGGGYLNKYDGDKELLFKRLYDMLPPIGKYHGEDICQIIVYFNNDEEVKKIKSLLDGEIFCGMHNVAEIFPEGADKSFALDNMAKMLNIPLENTCAIGDGHNDITMIKKAKLGIAMGNACKELKKEADYITTGMDDYGIYNALKHFNFID